jgi:hypothetical protein
MSFIVKMINNDRHVLTEEEYAALIRDGGVACNRTGVFVNLKSVADAFPEEASDEIEGRQKQTQGVLHDGTRVVKQFGEWFDADSTPDQRGLRTVRLDPAYYPEVARDNVPTPEEFEREYRALPIAERKAKMLSAKPETPRLSGGFKPVAALLSSESYAPKPS